jgi:hypothetical protein
MNDFYGLTNDELIAYYREDVNCRKVLSQYSYPHEYLLPESVVDTHIKKCQGLLFKYMRYMALTALLKNNIKVTMFELNKLVDKKFDQLYPLLLIESTKYRAEVVVNHINFTPSS